MIDMAIGLAAGCVISAVVAIIMHKAVEYGKKENIVQSKENDLDA